MPKDYNEPGNLVPKTVDEDPNLPQINVNGTLLHAETYGNNDSAMVIFCTVDRVPITGMDSMQKDLPTKATL